MNCLSINIQGAVSLEKRVWIKSLCAKFKINFLAIQKKKRSLLTFFLFVPFGVILHFLMSFVLLLVLRRYFGYLGPKPFYS